MCIHYEFIETELDSFNISERIDGFVQSDTHIFDWQWITFTQTSYCFMKPNNISVNLDIAML